MTYQEIKSFINTYIVQNGVNSITGSRLNTALNALADYYGFDSVVVTTLPSGSDATVNVQGRTLELGIPKGADGRDGQNAVNPFKGWFNSLDDLKASYTASIGDSAYVKDASPATTWSIYIYDETATTDNYWADSGIDADTSNVQTFASGEEVNQTYIDDTHLENPNANAVAKASDVAPLKSKLKDVTYEETIYNVSNNGIETQDEVYVNGNTGEFKEGTSIYQRTAIINVTGLSKITILAPYTTSSNVNWGWGFYETDEDTFAISGSYGVFDSGASVFSSKEYTLDVPENATVLRYTFSRNSTNPHGYNGIPTSDLYAKTQTGESITDMIEKAIDEVEDSIEEINDILLKEVYVVQTSESVDEKHFYDPTGEYKSSERINIAKYAIEEGKRYFFSGEMLSTQNYHCVAYLNGQGVWISNDIYRGGIVHSWDKQPLTIPQGAAYICLQVSRPFTELWELYSLETQPWDLGGVNEAIEDLDSRVTVIEQGSQVETLDTKLMKVVIKDGEILVRSRHSDTEDILIRMKDDKLKNSNELRNSLTLNSVYIAPKGTLSENDMMDSQYQIVSIEDSVGALGVEGFYYLYAQHGFSIPYGEKGAFTAADIGSIWEGQRVDWSIGKNFIVAHVDGTYVYFVPICSLNSTSGVYESSWNADDKYPTSFSYLSGGGPGHLTGEVNMSTDRFDLCVQTAIRKYVVDGIEVGNGTYFCNDFIFNEYVLGHNPATVDPTDWFDNPIPYDGELVNWCRSFVFKGSSVTLNQSIDVVNPFKLSVYFGCIPQMPMQYSITDGDVTTTYDSYTFIPKVRKNGRDAPFLTNNGSSAVTGVKNGTDLYDVNNLPDRIITFLKNNVIGYKVGMAGGLSLVHGITTKANRNSLLANYNSTIYTFGGNSSSTKNKFYTRILVPESFGGDHIVPVTFVKDFSCYYCWYNPNKNEDGLQVYTYKDGDSYVVYVHAWEEFDKVEINLPPYLNGLSVSGIIEKTEGAELLNDVVSCNKLYCSFSPNLSGEKNYIVFQVK